MLDSRSDERKAADISIRDGQGEDAATIAAMIADLANTVGPPDIRTGSAENMLTYGFGDSPEFKTILAEQDGEAVGLVLYFYTFSSWRGQLGVYVQDIHVVERLRGTGLGRRMLNEVARRGLKDRCTHLRLSVEPDNEAAQGFYERMGLARSHEVIFEATGDAFDQLGGASK